MCIVCITRGSTYFAAVPLPVHLGRGRAERRQGSRVRQGREKMKQRGIKNEGENNEEETEDEHGKGRGCQTYSVSHAVWNPFSDGSGAVPKLETGR